MISYNDLYEVLRKEKYSEVLQELPKKFLEEVSEYLNDKKGNEVGENELFKESLNNAKKQFENAIAIFRELILRRKKKILNLVFVAAETGIMKRDYENMLAFERDIFDKLVKTFEEGDKELSKLLIGKNENDGEEFKMIMFNNDVDEFVDHDGKSIGPFASGELANLNSKVCDILVEGGKASFVEED